MSDAVFFVMVGLLAAGAIALALVWPQGLGTPSPAPFGHPMEVVAPPPPVRAPPPSSGAIPVPGAPPPAPDLKGAL